MKPIRNSKYRTLFPYLLALPVVGLISAMVLVQEVKLLVILAICGVAVIAVVTPQRYLLFPVLLLALFPRNAPLFHNTTNALVFLFIAILFFRAIAEQRSPISMKNIVNNPFLLPSFCIWLSYLIAWVIVYFSNAPGMHLHSRFFIGITCALLLANIIVGFVKNKWSFQYIQLFLLLILLLNLFFGILFFLKPGLVIIPGIIEDRTSFANQSIRLSGLTFFWESYADFLMISTVITFGLIFTKTYFNNKKITLLLIILLLLSTIELLLTNTRGAIILASIGITTILLIDTNRSWMQKINITCGVVLIAGISLVIVTKTGQFNLVNRMDSFQSVALTEYGYMPSERAGAWLPAFRYVLENGVIGTGPSFEPMLAYQNLNGSFERWPHNLFLLILLTTGLLGLCSYSFLMFRILILKRQFRFMSEPRYNNFYKLLWLAIILLFIEGMKFDGFLRNPNSYFYFVWITIGLLFSSVNLIPNKR